MGDDGNNEISIRITGDERDAVAAIDRVKSKGTELGRTPIKLPVKADDPITDAWRAKVNAEIRAAAKDSLKIPMGVADGDRFRAKVGEILASTKAIAREEIPLQAVDGDRFKADVLKAVADARAKIKAFTTPGPVSDSTPSTVPLTALNPLDAAWRQQVEASIRSISKDALKIRATPDTAEFRADLGSQLEQIRTSVRQDIRANLTNADKFKADTLRLVQEIQAGVKAKIPVEADTASGRRAGISTAQAIAAGIAVGGPLVAGATVGVGVAALAGLGAAIQHGDSRIQAGWTQLATDAKYAGESASAGLVTPIASALTQIDQLVVREQPVFRSLFQAAGQDIAPLTSGFVGLAQNALPGLDNAMQHSMPIAQGLAQVERDVGTAIGAMGTAIATNASSIGQNLSQAGGTVRVFGSAVGDVVGITTHLASGALPVLNSALGGVEAVLHGVDSTLGPLITGLGTVGTLGVTAFAGIKLAGATVSGVKALADGVQSLGQKLSDYGAKAKAAATAEGEVASAATRMQGAVGGAASKMGGMLSSLGPAGLTGVGALAIGVITEIGQVEQAAAERTAAHQQAVQTLTQALIASKGAMDGNVASTVESNLQNAQLGGSISGVSKDLATVKNNLPSVAKAFDDLGISQKSVIDAISTGGQAYDELQGKLDKIQSGASGATADQKVYARFLLQTLPELKSQFKDSADAQKQYADAQGQSNVAMQQGAVVANRFATDWNNVANAVTKAPDLFTQASAGIKAMTDATVAADTGFYSARSSFAQLDQAVSQAQHGAAQASLGVASARHSEQQAARGVTEAQTSYRQSLQAEKQAQDSVAAARRAAQQQLEDLQRQVTDAADSQAEATLRLFDAQQAVTKAGLGGRSIESLGPLTAQNENAYQLLLQLQEAQHNLNDVNAQGAQLADQNAQAQAAGVNGAQGVVQAQQQLVSSQQAVAQASQAVKDAQDAEKQAHQATKEAQYQETQAQSQLKEAKDAASRSTDLNTAAGARNFTSIENLFEANYKATNSVDLATVATENQGRQLGFTRQAVDNVIGSLGGLDGKTAQFGIVGQPSVDISKIVSAAVQQGIDPEGLGFSPSQVQTALGGTPKKGTVHPYAAGGAATGGVALVGEYGPEVVRLPIGSQVYPTANVAGALDGLSGFASGGVSGALIRANLRLGTWDGAVAATGNTYNALGYQNIPQLPTSNPQSRPLASQAAFAGGSSSTGLAGSRAANKAIMQNVFAGFGWGSGAEWAAQDYLEMREAGYNNLAQNPTSTAFGMAQLLNGSWAGTGIAKTADPALQSLAMARYEAARYGDPIGAAAHERAYNWYAAGGPTSHGASVVGERGPEAVRLPRGGGGSGSASPYEVKVVIDISGATDGAFATAFMRMVRTGQIQLTANGQRVKVG